MARIVALIAILLSDLLGVLLLRSNRLVSLMSRELAASKSRIEELQSELDTVKKQPPPSATPETSIELLRLRGQVTVLRKELAEARVTNNIRNHQRKESSGEPATKLLAGDNLFQQRTNVISPHDEEVRFLLNQKEMEWGRWWQSFLAYAKDHEGNLPINFVEAEPYLPADYQGTIDVKNYQPPGRSGPRWNLNKMKSPNISVLFKEVVPLKLSDGLVCNVYLFGDGSVGLFQE
jgi:hypothetical protein